ncbi:CGNR zinc finger domain-containing protein [Microlunatus speluncae]|uniref:CGNR zinc finger domain-containing protein n=1 Tax=Microlunatus speluncae TaxID=2594267 RepID=UPI0012666C97|nr:CGNR zinc finger domain-containing protein [Microlunatus speluncae]
MSDSWPGHRDPSTAPGSLRLIEDLINSRSLVYGADDLTGPDELARWLSERELLTTAAQVRPADLRRAVIIREGLRATIARRLGGPDAVTDPEPIAALDRLAGDLPLTVALDPATGPRLRPRATQPVDAGLARLLGVVAEAALDGSWQRLKVCHNPACRWAYYDHSRNKSRTWCSMETCGNQAKARAFRRRH